MRRTKKALTSGGLIEIMPVQDYLYAGEERRRLYTKLMHNKGLRLVGGLLGSLLMSVAINVFIVPQGLYAGGAYGLCQVIRTLLQTKLGVEASFDLAGVLYFFMNLPLFLLADDAFQQRCLSGTIGADEGNDLSLLQMQVGAFHHRLLPVSGGQLFRIKIIH